MIKCKLKEMREYSCLPERKGERKKFGRYMHIFFPIKGYGRKRWVVAVHIELDNKHFEKDFSVEEITEQCLVFLNTPPQKKRGRPRKRPLYAFFEDKPYKATVKTDKKGEKYIQAYLIVSKRKNKVFWGSGDIAYTKRDGRRKQLYAR